MHVAGNLSAPLAKFDVGSWVLGLFLQVALPGSGTTLSVVGWVVMHDGWSSAGDMNQP